MNIKFKRLSIQFLKKAIKSLFISFLVDKKTTFIPIRYKNLFSTLHIIKEEKSSLIINGSLCIESFFGGNNNSMIHLGKNSTLTIDGDFIIGNGVKIFLYENAELYIGGKLNESASGITENTKIMVKKKMHIGKDCLISWNVFISDSDWHAIDGVNEQADVYIGDHVWIAPNVSILKGTKIGRGSIVSTNALTMNKEYPQNVLLAGSPANIKKNNVVWHRDMKQ